MIAIALLAGCATQQGSTPEGVTAPLQGTWRFGMTTITFDEAAHTFVFFDLVQNRPGTWTLTNNELDLACDKCLIEGKGQIRVDADHMLLDQVMTGSATVQAGASWTGRSTFVNESCQGGFMTAVNTVKLGATQAEEHSGSCCPGEDCSTMLLNTGTWAANADGFAMTTQGQSRQFFLVLGGISQQRWTRE